MMNFSAPADRQRPFFAPLRPRSDRRQELLREQVEKLLARLQRIGVRYEVAGAFPRESTPSAAGSDVELLILDDAGLRDFRIWEIAWDEVPDGEVTLMFARDSAEDTTSGSLRSIASGP